MLYWICPECGHECSPAIRECPTCSAAENAAPAGEGILSAPQNFQSVPPPHSKPAKPEVAPVEIPATAPALVAVQSPEVEFGLKLAGLAPINDITFQAARLHVPKAHEQPVEPAPSRRRSVAFVRRSFECAPECADTNQLAVADLAQPGELLPAPLKAGIENSSWPLPPQPGRPACIASKIEVAGESLSDLLHALQKSAEEFEQASIRAIHASFLEQPSELLLCAPGEIVTAPAPPTEQWLRSPRLVFVPQAPGNAGLASLFGGPQMPTLAGPCLPPQLQRFQGNPNSNRRLARKRAAAPAWMLSVLVAIVLFLAGVGLLQYLTANRDAKAASVPPASTHASEPVPAPSLPVAPEHPGARFVEVAGVRVVTAPNRKPQLQYIVINHSAAELTGLNIHLALHSADSPSGAPLIRVSSIVPSLAANQSKEIRTDLDADLNAASLPDWQSLRTDILISRQ